MVSRAFGRIAAARVAATSPKQTKEQSPKQTEEQQRVVQVGELLWSQPGNVVHELQGRRGNHHLRQSVLRELQGKHGNRYVQQLVNRAGPPIQTKLRLGPVGDQYEQEADRVARTAAHELVWPAREAGGGAPGIRHRPSAGGGDVDAGVRSAVERARGGGRPLAQGVRGQMEQALGADFSGVRVHSDALADRLNGSLNARAFTTGRDIFFRSGEYSPSSSAGQRLLAHELVHVVQQGTPGRSGSGEGRTSDGVIQRVSRKGSYTFTGVRRDLTNKYRPVFLMSTQTDMVSDGEDVVVKFEPDDELMEELFFSKVAGRSNQMVPDMRRAYKPEIKRCKEVVRRDLAAEVTYDNALVMDYVPGSKLEMLRAEKLPYQLNDEQLRNIGRLLAFQIFMGGEDMLPAPDVARSNAGNVIVSTGSGAVSMIDVTGGGSYRNRTVHPDVRTGVKELLRRRSGGPLTEEVRRMLAGWTGTGHDVGKAGRKKMRQGFKKSMQDIAEFDLEQLYADWQEVFPEYEYEDAMAFMRETQKLFQTLLG